MQEKQSTFNKTLENLSYVAVVAAALVLIWKLAFPDLFSNSGAGQRMEKLEDISVGKEFTKNSTGNGPVAVIEFSDFECPSCRGYALQTWPAIKQNLIETGKISYIGVQFPIEGIHPMALGAAIAAECASEQSKYWDMHDRLFNNTDGLNRSAFLHYASQLGLDTDSYQTCLDSETPINTIRSHQQEAHRLAINATPSFLVGKVQADGSILVSYKLIGFHTADEFNKIINEVSKL